MGDAVKITWTITDCTSTNEADPVIQQAFWKCTATDGGKTATLAGVQDLTGLKRATRIPFVQLAKKQVINWCFLAGVDQVGVEAQLAAEVALQLKPALVSGSPPWVGKDADDIVIIR